MAKLFNILSREQKYKDKYLESAGALTAFERHYSANPLSKEQQSKYTLLQNDLTYAEQKIAKFKAKNDK
ncbi:MAG: hypothetical protein V2I33_21075 [Kangiellaceae bacterium]|jgi:hypothetical protein|nr:hypothetical protein [Kangiellaceae bacterium]